VIWRDGNRWAVSCGNCRAVVARSPSKLLAESRRPTTTASRRGTGANLLVSGRAFPSTSGGHCMRARSVLFLVIILIAVFMPDLILGFVGEFLNQFKDALHQATAR
jgi:hypothetical protein